MELKLQKFVKNCEEIAVLRDLDEANPVKIPITHPNSGLISVIVCSIPEPVHLALPLNVIWINLDPNSIHFRHVLRRASKALRSPYLNTWNVIHKFDGLFERQYYDSDDLAVITEQSNVVGIASESVVGAVKLSFPAEDPNNPIACGDNDPRLLDSRRPLPHTHPQVPATHLAFNSGAVAINGSPPPQAGMVLVATSSTEAAWRYLTELDIVGA